MQQLNIVRTSILCALFKVTSKIRKHFIRDTFKFVVAIYSFRMQFIYRISIPTIRTRIYTVNILIYYLKTLHLWLSETQISPIGKFDNQRIVVQIYVIYRNQLEPFNEFFYVGIYGMFSASSNYLGIFFVISDFKYQSTVFILHIS